MLGCSEPCTSKGYVFLTEIILQELYRLLREWTLSHSAGVQFLSLHGLGGGHWPMLRTFFWEAVLGQRKVGERVRSAPRLQDGGIV